MAVAMVLVAVAVLVGIVLFLRAVFGGGVFRRTDRRDRDDDGRGDQGPRADAHAGASTWTGAGGLGRWGTWSDPG